jgi:hypothetical protein
VVQVGDSGEWLEQAMDPGLPHLQLHASAGLDFFVVIVSKLRGLAQAHIMIYNDS